MAELLERATDSALANDRFPAQSVSRGLQVLGGLPLIYFLVYSVPAVLEPPLGHMFPGAPAFLGIVVFPFALILYAGGYLMLFIRLRRNRDQSPPARLDRLMLLAPACFPALLVGGIMVRTLLR